MNTTAIIIEILIVGIISSIWPVFIVLTVFGNNWIPAFFDALKGWEVLSSFFIIAFLYTLGIFMDRFADVFSIILKPKNKLLNLSWISSKSDEAHKDGRMEIMVSEKKATAFLEHIRTRIRIMRATIVNIPLILFSLVLFLNSQKGFGNYPFYELIIACVGIFLALYISVGVLEATYAVRLNQALEYQRNYNISKEIHIMKNGLIKTKD